MRSILVLLVSLSLSLSFMSIAQAGTTYKWVDGNGNTVYSQHPPAEGIPFERIRTKSGPPAHKSSTAPASSTSAKDSILQDKAARNESDLVRQEMQKNEELRAKNCKLARDKLRFYQVQRRWKDKDGNVKSLSEKERKAKLEEAKAEVADYCS